MDSKHRHELEQNLLAKWLVSQYEDWIRPNSSWLGYAVLGVIVVVAVIIVTARINTWNQNAAWKQYHSALHSEQAETELELVAASTSGIVGAYARLALAQHQLSEGCSQVFINKKDAIGLLEKAIVSFQQVQTTTNDSLILQQAGYGLGRCRETLAAARIGDDLAKAEEEYQKIINQWGGESFTGKLAQKQLALIRQPATKTFLELTAAKTVEDTEIGISGKSFDLDDQVMPEQFSLGALEQEPAPEEQKPEEQPE